MGMLGSFTGLPHLARPGKANLGKPKTSSPTEARKNILLVLNIR